MIIEVSMAGRFLDLAEQDEALRSELEGADGDVARMLEIAGRRGFRLDAEALQRAAEERTTTALGGQGAQVLFSHPEVYGGAIRQSMSHPEVYLAGGLERGPGVPFQA